MARGVGGKVLGGDFKGGEEHVDPGDAEANLQLQFYAALWFWLHPECEEVEVVIWGVKYGFKNKDHYIYHREQACDLVAARIEAGFDKLDALHAAYAPIPDADWPALAVCHLTCTYCPVTYLCPPNVADVAEIMAGDYYIKPRKPRSKK